MMQNTENAADKRNVGGDKATRELPAMLSVEALLVGKATAARLTGISARSIDRLVSCGKFLRPVRLGGRVLWNRDRLIAWVHDGCRPLGEARP
jgi:predicted DNA-binding transcriptional regulator AlpA